MRRVAIRRPETAPERAETAPERALRPRWRSIRARKRLPEACAAARACAFFALLELQTNHDLVGKEEPLTLAGQQRDDLLGEIDSHDPRDRDQLPRSAGKHGRAGSFVEHVAGAVTSHALLSIQYRNEHVGLHGNSPTSILHEGDGERKQASSLRAPGRVAGRVARASFANPHATSVCTMAIALTRMRCVPAEIGKFLANSSSRTLKKSVVYVNYTPRSVNSCGETAIWKRGWVDREGACR